ncbi:uncharacterized protein LOC120104226 [Phoenix dactylifera]|uniref:Uncharacterized protein LOC120104226 n=1 Tax=Phoenix dactylifera TaxID=42345 RepID=A0A8B8ZHM7_PHODC|nr:uncharacterized protein LOC120104226 [Phoenix dactylifera]
MVSPKKLEKAKSDWSSSTVLVRSLGRRIPADWIGRELTAKVKFGYEAETFQLAEDYVAMRFRREEDREAAMMGGLWLVAGQLLVMECWQANFVLGVNKINRLLVWVQLPGLPLEFWAKDTIMEVAAAAGRPVAMDGFTESRRRMGYAQVKVEVDASLPLWSSVFLRGWSNKVWQNFAYESLPVVCYRCGLIGHGEEDCGAANWMPGRETGAETGGPKAWDVKEEHETWRQPTRRLFGESNVEYSSRGSLSSR